MVSTCLNEELILRAVSGTSVNSTLLIEAFAPLCPKQSLPVEAVANHAATVIVGYVCGFLPWGFLVLIDFISSQWKPIRNTKRSGYLHLAFSLIPMLFVIAYAVLQAISADYKEMMTAIAAVVITKYHVLRYVWGLIQLHSFENWCDDALTVCDIISGNKNTSGSFYPNLPDRKTRLMVNDELISDEFTDCDIPLSASLKLGEGGLPKLSFRLKSAELCTVRWASAFLCALGNEWHRGNFIPILPCITTYLVRCTFLVPGRRSEKSLANFFQFAVMWRNTGVRVGAYNSFLNNFRPWFVNRRSESTLDAFEFEIENIKSSFPAEYSDGLEIVKENRRKVQIHLVDMLLFAKGLGPEILSALKSVQDNEESFQNYIEKEQALTLFLKQAAPKERKLLSLKDIHPFWQLLLVFPWRKMQTKNALQASLHIDIVSSLFLGDALMRELTLDRSREVSAEDEFVFCQRKVRKLSLNLFKTFTLGVSLEAVRTVLAEWVCNNNEESLKRETWTPVLSTKPFLFSASDSICDAFASERRVIWECQYALHSSIADQNQSSAASPSSEVLMMFFICSFPALRVIRFDNENICTEQDILTMKIVPILGPQDITLEFNVVKSTGNASLKFVLNKFQKEGISENPVPRFEWGRWINSAMGLMKGHNEKVKIKLSSEGFGYEGPLDLIHHVDLTRGILHITPRNSDIPNLPGPIQVWRGWLSFDARVCQFEKDQWMRAGNVFEDYEVRRKQAEESLAGISSSIQT